MEEERYSWDNEVNNANDIPLPPELVNDIENRNIYDWDVSDSEGSTYSSYSSGSSTRSRDGSASPNNYSETDSSKSEASVKLLYSEREEWKDIQPLPQYLGPAPVCPINYSPQYNDVMSYFRAVIHKHEISQRALDLTMDCITYSPTNYTVWQYRRQCLRALGCNLVEELIMMENLCLQIAKNYQIWFHRQSLINECKFVDHELELTEKVLAEDSKNYHAWQHRQWVLQYTNDYSKELEYVEKLIDIDVRNNSAWNQRWFVLKQTNQFNNKNGIGNMEICTKELFYVLRKARLDMNNYSPWYYLRGVFIETGITSCMGINQTFDELYEKFNKIPAFLSFLTFYYTRANEIDRVIKYYNELIEIDPLRTNLYKLKIKTLTEKKEKSS